MKIAVTYENGMVFQHFGKSEAFKYYETDEWGDIVAAEVKSTDGQGHGALAEILKANGVDVLICGGIGQGVQDALAENGIEVYAGNAGAADGVLLMYIIHHLQSGFHITLYFLHKNIWLPHFFRETAPRFAVLLQVSKLYYQG